jgi:hypothetical protein
MPYLKDISQIGSWLELLVILPCARACGLFGDWVVLTADIGTVVSSIIVLFFGIVL